MLPLLIPLLACAATLLAGCAGAGAAGSGLTLYNGQHEQTTALLVAAFERSTGIHVEVRSGDEATLGNEIVQEGASSPADLFFSENSPVLEALRERGLLAPVSTSTLAQVPRPMSSAAGSWVGVSARVSALIYNTSRLGASKLPSSILALARPPWKGKLAFAPSETDFQPLLSAIVHLEGTRAAERWLEGLRANGTVYPDNETIVNQVNNAQSAAGPIDSYYWYRLRAELGGSGVHSALHYFAAGDPGDLLDVSGAAVLGSSRHKRAAQAFLAFLVSAAGQQLIAHSHSYEYPLRPGIGAAPGLPALSSLSPASLTPAQLGDGSASLALEQKLGLL